MLHGIKTNILTTGARAIAALASGVIGIVATADDAQPEVKASLAIGTVAANNALTFTSKLVGKAGNDISVRLVDPAANDAALAVAVAGAAITVSLATGPAGAITTTAALLKTAIEAHADANALVSLANTGTSTGAGVVAALAKTFLSGGVDEAFPLNTPVLVTDLRAALAKAGTTGTMKAAFEAIYDQASPILVVVRVAEDDEDQDTPVIGDAGTYTGLHALLAAESVCGVRPRVIGAPGLDTQAVTTALVSVAQKLCGMVYAAAIGAAVADVLLYRANFAARELMLIWPNWSNAFAGDAVARALGLRAQIDEETGWHKSISNVAVNGVTGISEILFFDIQDETTDVATLNDAEVTALVRSPAGGFVYWGNRTCSDEPLFAFEPAVRTSQILQDEIAKGLVWASDKPLTKFLVKDVIDTINARIRSLVTQGRLIGGKAWFDPALNSEADLAAGKLVIDYEFTPAAPLEGLTLNQRITDKYYADLAAELAA